MSICERKKELRRRRHRKVKLAKLSKKLKSATVSEKTVITEKIRNLTPGSGIIIENWGLGKR